MHITKGGGGFFLFFLFLFLFLFFFYFYMCGLFHILEVENFTL